MQIDVRPQTWMDKVPFFRLFFLSRAMYKHSRQHFLQSSPPVSFIHAPQRENTAINQSCPPLAPCREVHDSVLEMKHIFMSTTMIDKGIKGKACVFIKMGYI